MGVYLWIKCPSGYKKETYYNSVQDAIIAFNRVQSKYRDCHIQIRR